MFYLAVISIMHIQLYTFCVKLHMCTMQWSNYWYFDLRYIDTLICTEMLRLLDNTNQRDNKSNYKWSGLDITISELQNPDWIFWTFKSQHLVKYLTSVDENWSWCSPSLSLIWQQDFTVTHLTFPNSPLKSIQMF